MLDLVEIDSPLTRELPAYQVLACLVERGKRRTRDELWRTYLANIVPMWGGKDTKPWLEIVERYERAATAPSDKKKAVEDAYKTADDVIRKLEQSRKARG